MTLHVTFIIELALCKIIRKLGLLCLFPFAERKKVVQRFVVRNFKNLVQQVSKAPKDKSSPTAYTNNTIWVFWAQGRDNMPPVVRACMRQIEKMKGDYQVIVLDKNSYKDFVDIPEAVLKKLEEGKITLTHFSDILRFALLYKYGGWWMDATIYPTVPIERKTKLYSIKTERSDKYISECMWSSFLWYMPAGHKMARFLSMAWKEYWENNDKLVEYFLIDHLIKLFYETDYDFRKEIDGLPEENKWLYFMQSEDSDKEFEEASWKKICQETRFFKCNWRADISNPSSIKSFRKIFFQ